MKVRRWRTIALIHAALILGCAAPTGTDPGAERTKLAQSRQTWAAAGIDSYRMTVRLHGAWVTGAAVIEVRGGAPISITVIEGSHGPPAFEQHDTVEELFLEVEKALEQSAEHLETVYHSSLGFPIYVDVDLGPWTADDERGFTVSDFTVLP